MMKTIKNIDKPLLIISLLLFLFGLLMIFSASNVTAFMKYSASPYRYFMKQGFFLLLSIVFSTALLFVPSKYYRLCSRFAILIITALLIYIRIYGVVRGNAKSWIDLGFMSFQPSEFAKIIVIVYLASFYDKYKNRLNKPLVCFKSLIFPIVIAFLIFIQPDLGTTIIFTLIVSVLFFISNVNRDLKKKIFISIILVLLMGVMVLKTNGEELLKPGQRKRFDISNPCSEEKFYSTGNQVCNGYIAINNGGITGVGLGDSTQKYLYLPEAHTDFIFAIIVEELGVVSVFVLLLLYFLLLGRILKIGKDSINETGRIICFGVAFYILIHIIINLFGVLGIMPLTGVPLPFMSYGGSYAMCLVFALTFVQRINIDNNISKKN